MSAYPPITLRYFDRVRGRAQFIRGFLVHRGIPFLDERIVLTADRSSWQETRQDRRITGDFQKLPTLEWGEVRLSETLVILDFLHRRVGDAAPLDENTNLRHAMLTSSAYLDVLTPCVQLIWLNVLAPGVDIARAVPIAGRRLGLHLATLNQTLGEWGWLERGKEATVRVADAVLWEALDMVSQTFEEGLALGNWPVLERFYETCAGAETFRSLLEANPAHMTGHPDEPAALEAIRMAVRSGTA